MKDNGIKSFPPPLFYKNPVPLNIQVHSGLIIGPGRRGFGFAEDMRSVALCTVEFFDSARFYPILFTAVNDGHYMPVVLMGLKENENLFVDERGIWRAPYIPACLRCYPFTATREKDGGLTIIIDEAFEGFNREGGSLLFKNGEPTPQLIDIRTFLDNYDNELRRTAQLCAELSSTGLLKQISSPSITHGGYGYRLEGLYVVDEEKLNKMPAREIVVLFRRGILTLIQTHLLSLGNFERLRQMISRTGSFNGRYVRYNEIVTCHTGCFRHQFSQTVRKISMVLDCPEDINVVSLDKWLKSALEIDVKPCVCLLTEPDLATGSASVIDLVHRCMLTIQNLFQAAGIPAFDPGAILSIERDRIKPSRWQVVVALANIDETDETTEICYRLAVDGALKIVQTILSGTTDPQQIKQLYGDIEDQAIRPLRNIIVSGKSTIPLLRAAHHKGIPFFHIGGGVYQLGWGCKARRLDRSICENDSLIGAKFAQDKILTAALLRMAGLPAPDHGIAQSEDDALRLFRRFGCPVVVKPVDLDRGEGVTTGVQDEATLLTSFRLARNLSRIKKVIIEIEAPGVCHRVLVANGRVLYVHKRLPVGVTGDGKQTVAELIRSANLAENAKVPWMGTRFFPDDAMAVESIRKAGYSLESVLGAGVRIPLRPRESTEWGGDDEDCTHSIHPANIAVALQAASLLGLSIAGIDMISTDITEPWYMNGAVINEMNFSPTLGDSEMSGTYIPSFFADFIEGDGRIPIDVYVGAKHGIDKAKERHRKGICQGVRCFLTSESLTIDSSGSEVSFPYHSLFRRCRALLMNRDVEELILVVQTDEFLQTGLPADRFNSVTAVDDEITSWKDHTKRIPHDRANDLLDYLSVPHKQGR